MTASTKITTNYGVLWHVNKKIDHSVTGCSGTETHSGGSGQWITKHNLIKRYSLIINTCLINDTCLIKTVSLKKSEYNESAMHLKRDTGLLTLSPQRLISSGVKCGSCFRYESFFHMACVTICARSIAAKPGDRYPLLLSTSTHAWISRIALPRISSVSDWSSADSCIRDMWAWSNRLVLTCGSLNFAPGCNLFGSRCDNYTALHN